MNLLASSCHNSKFLYLQEIGVSRPGKDQLWTQWLGCFLLKMFLTIFQGKILAQSNIILLKDNTAQNESR